MVLFLLEMAAELQNVAKVHLPNGHSYMLTVKNSSGEDIREGVTVTSAEEQELAGSRGIVNFAIKWVRDARNQANLNVIEKIKGVTLQLTADDEQKYAPLVGFECRGLEPTAWQLQDGFIVETTSGQCFEDVDLSEGEWVDYDEKLGESVSIMDLKWRFTVRR